MLNKIDKKLILNKLSGENTFNNIIKCTLASKASMPKCDFKPEKYKVISN